MKTGTEMIAEERQRQITAEGWTPEHDDEHNTEEMAKAAAVYAIPRTEREPIFWNLWPWHDSWWKPGDRIRELVKAGALIAAEIDRLNRLGPNARHKARRHEGKAQG